MINSVALISSEYAFGFEEAKVLVQEGKFFELSCLHDENRCDVLIGGYMYEMTELEFDELCRIRD